MKIGIIREGKVPPDKRVPFTPEQCKKILEKYTSVELYVQRSPIRAFEDEEYAKLGINLVDGLANCDIIFGVKEVNIQDLLPNKKYFFFSHTIKKQPYNRGLLLAVLEKNIQLIDYECLTKKSGARLVGFGRYAGIVGAYNSFLAYGKQNDTYELKAAHRCANRSEMEEELPKIILPNNYKVVITGLGRVAGGAIEILEKIGLQKVSPQDFLNNEFTKPVFTQLSVEDYFKHPDGKEFTRAAVYEDPSLFERNFMPYAQVSDMYISCHFWDARGPVIFTAEELKSPDFNIKVIGDISCDIDGPIPTTLRPSTIADPIYYVNPKTRTEEKKGGDNIAVMAVDNLPCELPKDASEDFGKELINKVLDCLIIEDPHQVIERATIAKEGKLGSHFQYLQDYIEGN